MDSFFFDFDDLPEKKAAPGGQGAAAADAAAPDDDPHRCGSNSSVNGAETCKSKSSSKSSAWQTAAAGLSEAEEAGCEEERLFLPLARSSTCSSLASSWCSDSEPVTPTTAQHAQDRWTPAVEPEDAASAEGRIACGLPKSRSSSSLYKGKSCEEEEEELEIESFLLQLAKRAVQTLMPSELVGLITGRDFWHNHGVARAGIPALRFTDGPFGVRGPNWVGPCSVVTPCGMALGSSWNCELVQAVGTLLGEEAKVKGAHVLLGPDVNLARVPLAGRNYELLGEDPEHVSRLGVAYIRGVQSVECMAACVKHLAVNDQERSRFFINAVVDEKVLHSLHFIPFEAAVKEGGVMAVMAAYNRINGVFCSENKWLIQDVLRNTWGFTGMVVSDWGGTHSTEASLKAGLDMEMPKLAHMFYGDRLQKLLGEGKVAIADVRSRATMVLKFMARIGLLRGDSYGITSYCGNSKRSSMGCSVPTDQSPDNSPDTTTPTMSPVQRGSPTAAYKQRAPAPLPATMDAGRPRPSPNSPEQVELLQRAAREGIVLLKNKNQLLPLKRNPRVAVIGPHAGNMIIMGGGSSRVLPNRSERSLMAQLRARGIRNVTYEEGVRPGLYLPTLAPPFLRTKDGRGVLWGEFFDESGKQPSKTAVARSLLQHWDMGNWSGIFFNDPPGKMTDWQPWSAVFEGVLRPEVTGPHELGLFSSGTCKLFLDGSLILQYPKPGQPPFPHIPMSILAPEVRKVVHLEAGRQYEVKVNWASLKEGQTFPAQCHLSGCPVVDEDELLESAVASAAAADVAVVCVGTDHWQECEGRDMASMELPGRSSELVSRVAKANPKTVVVLNVGSPKELDPWLQDAAALLVAWFGGQEAAAGLADVLLGLNYGPCGRLPMTWPRSLEQLPTGKPPNLKYPGESGKVLYDEGMLLGYRWYDAKGLAPAFVFGEGHSYTVFEYIDFTLPEGESYEVGGPVRALVTVENIGEAAGMEVMQMYLMRVPPRPGGVQKELAAFAKVALEPGDIVDAELEVPARMLEEPGEFELAVGPSSADFYFKKRILIA